MSAFLLLSQRLVVEMKFCTNMASAQFLLRQILLGLSAAENTGVPGAGISCGEVSGGDLG